MSEEAFGLLGEQVRPFGVRVVAYPRRDDLKHLEACGVIGFFMGPADGPSMDRGYVVCKEHDQVNCAPVHTCGYPLGLPRGVCLEVALH